MRSLLPSSFLHLWEGNPGDVEIFYDFMSSYFPPNPSEQTLYLFPSQLLFSPYFLGFCENPGFMHLHPKIRKQSGSTLLVKWHIYIPEWLRNGRHQNAQWKLQEEVDWWAGKPSSCLHVFVFRNRSAWSKLCGEHSAQHSQHWRNASGPLGWKQAPGELFFFFLFYSWNSSFQNLLCQKMEEYCGFYILFFYFLFISLCMNSMNGWERSEKLEFKVPETRTPSHQCLGSYAYKWILLFPKTATQFWKSFPRGWQKESFQSCVVWIKEFIHSWGHCSEL